MNMSKKSKLHYEEKEGSFTSFEHAKSFLEDFHAQIGVYLMEMNMIEKHWENSSNDRVLNSTELKLLKEQERDCNRIFEKLRDRICKFMENSQGVHM